MSEYIEDRIKKLEKGLSLHEIEITASQLYIKELKERVKALQETVEDLKEQTNILADDYKIFRSEDYTNQSTEEFVRVKHGYWFVDIYKCGDDRCECSECCYKQLRQTKYCPNCGAKMENAKK